MFYIIWVVGAKIFPGKSPIISAICFVSVEHSFHMQTRAAIGHCFSIALKLKIKVFCLSCTIMEEILIVSLI